MSETKTTLWFVGVAAVLTVLAFLLAPKRITPGAFQDQGEPFYPQFTDPNSAATLEVIDFDQATGGARPFKVTFSDGRWTIPSHDNYPADAADRLAKTAAGVIGITKDDFRSDRIADQEVCGVVDPLDETAGLAGRGKRVTLKGKNSEVLADLVFGNPVEGREGFQFVRVPGQSRIYASKVELDISTRFKDWINTDVLEVAQDKIDQITFDNYRINERTNSLEPGEVIVLNRDGRSWRVDGMKSSQKIDSTRVDQILKALDDLTIVDVRPKPAGLSASLKAETKDQSLSREDLLSLRSRGFFVSRDGQLLSNEGEIRVRTTDGIRYTLRFGEIASGTDEAGDQRAGTGENRYLFVTTDFDRKLFPEPSKPANNDFAGKADSLLTDADRDNRAKQNAYNVWTGKINSGETLNTRLNQRFAEWYYVISGESFDKLRVKRSDLLTSKS